MPDVLTVTLNPALDVSTAAERIIDTQQAAVRCRAEASGRQRNKRGAGDHPVEIDDAESMTMSCCG